MFLAESLLSKIVPSADRDLLISSSLFVILLFSTLALLLWLQLWDRFTIILLNSVSCVLSELLSLETIPMQLVFLEGTYFSFSCCLCSYNGAWASRVRLSAVSFAMSFGTYHGPHVLVAFCSGWKVLDVWWVGISEFWTRERQREDTNDCRWVLREAMGNL